jgi:hypothetical protein
MSLEKRSPLNLGLVSISTNVRAKEPAAFGYEKSPPYLINQTLGEKLRYYVEGLALRLWTLP